MNYSCQECKARMYPDNPSLPWRDAKGHLLPAFCDTCYMPERDRDTYSPPPVEVRFSHKEQEAIEQTQGELVYLRKKLKELLKRKEEDDRYY